METTKTIFKPIMAISTLLFALLFMASFPVFSQGGAAINTTGAAASPSAMLDVSSSDAGILIPRMTEVQKNGIPSPSTGLMIYQTDGVKGFWYYDGVAWVQSIGIQGPAGLNGLDGPTGATGTSCCPTHYIGESYGGGVVYYVYNTGGTEHGLIVSPIDISLSAEWSNVSSTRIGGTTHTNGSENTTAIISQSGHVSSAALLCRNYNGGGFNDWYLPAIDELAMIHKERYIINSILGVDGIKYGIDTDDDDYYWSSTEGPNCTDCVWGYYGLYNSAWHPNGNASWNYDNKKYNNKAVRCVRSF